MKKYSPLSKYSTEADVLNMALFGKTAKQWREQNPKEKKRNIQFPETTE
jgi:hypothetical protein